MFLKTKFIKEELNRTPENQSINLNKLKQYQTSRRSSLKASMRQFIAQCLINDKTFREIKHSEHTKKNSIDLNFEERFVGIEERLNNLSKK